MARCVRGDAGGIRRGGRQIGRLNGQARGLAPRDASPGGKLQIHRLGARGIGIGPALHLVAIGGDQKAVFIQLECTIARVSRATGGIDDKKAIAIDGHVQAIGRGRNHALAELLGDGRHTHADTGPGAAGALARAHGAGDHLVKFSTRFFKTDGVAVGNVVAADIQAFAGGVQARKAVVETHGATPLSIS